MGMLKLNRRRCQLLPDPIYTLFDKTSTSQQIRDRYAIPLEDADFEIGGLKRKSNIRPNRIFTADRRIILYKAGSLKRGKLEEAIRKIIAILQK